MYAGEIVLEGPVRKILKEPIHPYTYGLLKSIPKLSLDGLPDSMPGTQPQPGHVGEGCSFYERCTISDEKCKVTAPKLEYVKKIDTYVRCFHYNKVTDKKDKDILLNNSQEKKIDINEILNLTDISVRFKISLISIFFSCELFNKISLSFLSVTLL